MIVKVCKAGNGNPKCEYKRNSKGTEAEVVGVLCAYGLECKFKMDYPIGGQTNGST